MKSHRLGDGRGQRAAAAQQALERAPAGFSASASEPPIGRRPRCTRRTGGPGGSRRRPETCDRRSIPSGGAGASASPMPESISSCGEPIAPAERMTSRGPWRPPSPRSCRRAGRRARDRPRSRARATVARGAGREVRPSGGGTEERVGGAPAAAVLLVRGLDDAVLLGRRCVAIGGSRPSSSAASTTGR